MSKIRIYELAKQLGVANKELMARMKEIGIEATSHMSMLGEEDADKVTKLYRQNTEKKDVPKQGTPKQDAPKQEAQKPAPKQDAQKQGDSRRRTETADTATSVP